MRAPILHGLGKVSFSYTGVDANAEIWVQMATNDVESYITELNTTVKEGPEYWITIGKYAATYKPGIDGLLVTGSGKTGSITHYLGLHDRTDRPLRGLFRILVPTNVVAAARNEKLMVLSAKGNVLRMLPPLNVSEAECNEALAKLDVALAMAAK